MIGQSARLVTAALGVLGAAWAAPLQASAQPADAGAVNWILDARLRYESVAQDGLADADALTLRARMGLETASFRGVSALAEIEGVAHLIDDFNDTVNGKTEFAVIADPDTIELNRLQLAWSGRNGRRAIVGRQRIILNNARFIGNVGFRQNEQTFDAVRLEARPFEPATVTYLYLDNVRRVFGEDSAQGVWRSDSHVLQLDLAAPLGRLSAYGLWLDFQNAPAQSGATFGLRWQHELADAPLRPRFAIEAAQQSDYRGDGADFELGYQSAELALRGERLAGLLGAERLEGDGARGFATPLATLHAFQGWADVFLTTPPDGVRDLYAGLSYSTQPWPAAQPAALTLVAHDFADADGGADFGVEWDVSARIALNPRTALEAKAAHFDGADPRFADRTKFWLALEYRL